MHDTNNLWNIVLEKLELSLSNVSYSMWFKDSKVIDLADDVLFISAKSTFAKNQILKNYFDKLKSAVDDIFGENIEIEILDPDEEAKYVAKNKPAETKDIEPVKNPLNPKFTFNNFVVGKSNQTAYAASKAVAENPGKTFNPLFLYGGVGLGKTHLLHAIGNAITEQHPDLNVVYVTIEKFTNDLIESIQKGSNSAKSEFRTKYRNADVLIVDDVQFIINKNSVQEEFFHTFNELNQNGKQIVISSDKPPKEINPLEERLRSRFEWGLIADIGLPDIETRIAILNKKASLERYNVEPEVISYIADAVKTNIREMEGMLARAVFYAGLLGQPRVTMDTAREALKNYLIQTEETVDAGNILDVVCKYYNLKKEELLARKRTKEIAEARQIAMFLIAEFINMPLASIGSIFGKDHATVIYAKNKVAEDIKKSPKLAVQINDMKQMIKCK